MAFFKINRQKAKARAVENERRNATRGVFGYLKDGKTVFRILPPWSKRAADEGLAYLRIGQHRIFETYYLCPAMSDHLKDTVGDCAICDVVGHMRERGARKQSDIYSVRVRVAVPAVIRDKEKGDRVCVLSCPGQLAEFIDAKINDESEYSVGDFTDTSTAGRDIIATKTGKGLSTRYQFDFVDSSHKRPASKDLKALTVPDLDQIYAWTDEQAEEVAAVAEKIRSRFEQTYSDDVESAGVGDEVEEVAEDSDTEVVEEAAEATDEVSEEVETSDDESTEEAVEAEADAEEATDDDTPTDEDEELPTAEDPDEPQEDVEVEQPKIDPRTKKPVCFLQYVERNPEGPPTTDPQCAICAVEAICQHKSLQGSAPAAAPAAAPVKKPAPAAAPVKKPAPATAPAKKPTPSLTLVTNKKPAPVAAPVKKPAPAAAPVKKPVPAAKPPVKGKR